MGAIQSRAARTAILTGLALITLAGCGKLPNPFAGGVRPATTAEAQQSRLSGAEPAPKSTFFDLFTNSSDPNTTIEVNKYLWNASLDVLNFLPIESADPFSGVIVTGYGTPPGGRTAYRATIYIRDPALEARSLSLALATRSGPAPDATVRAVEDAIMTRARQLRIKDLNL